MTDRARGLAGLAALAAGTAILYIWPPDGNSFYPPCAFRALTGWLCPGCGATRALYQLLHGNVMGALALNPLATVVAPPAFAAAGIWFGCLASETRWSLRVPDSAAWAALSVTVAFGIWRNVV